MSQVGHDPHGYNPVAYQCINLDMILTATIPWLINVSTRTRSSRRQSHGLSMSQLGHDPHGYNPVAYQCLN